MEKNKLKERKKYYFLINFTNALFTTNNSTNALFTTSQGPGNIYDPRRGGHENILWGGGLNSG